MQNNNLSAKLVTARDFLDRLLKASNMDEVHDLLVNYGNDVYEELSETLANSAVVIDPKLIADAAEAEEHFSADELEQAAAKEKAEANKRIPFDVCPVCGRELNHETERIVLKWIACRNWWIFYHLRKLDRKEYKFQHVLSENGTEYKIWCAQANYNPATNSFN